MTTFAKPNGELLFGMWPGGDVLQALVDNRRARTSHDPLADNVFQGDVTKHSLTVSVAAVCNETD